MKRNYCQEKPPLPRLLEPVSPRTSSFPLRPFQSEAGSETTVCCHYVNKYQRKYKYLLIDQINDDVDHLVGLCLLSIVLASESELLGKEPGVEMIMVVADVKVLVLVNLFAAVD